MKRKTLLVTVTVLALLLLAAPAFAQGDTPTDPVSLEDALARLLSFITDVTFVPAAAALVTMATSLIKRFVPETVPAGAIALVAQVVVWVAYVVTGHFGLGEQFSTVLDVGTRILEILLPVILAALGSSGLYSLAKRGNIAVVGYARS